MSDTLWEKAEELAARPYAITIERDQLADGQTSFFVKNPELPGCKAEGMTLDEAKSNLAEARVDYIHALLEEGLPIPEPPRIRLTTFSGAGGATMDKQPAVDAPLIASFSLHAKP